MSEEYWMGMTREEYLLLSYILLQIGPEGEAIIDPDHAAEALGLDAAKVRELLESLQRKRLLTLVSARVPETSVPVAKRFEAFRSAQVGPEGFSYFKREIRTAYLTFYRSLRALLGSTGEDDVHKNLNKALFYNAKLEQYRNLGEITLSQIEKYRPFHLETFDTNINILFQISLYLYPIGTLLAKTLETPWGEKITVYMPSTKAIQARLKSIDELILLIREKIQSEENQRMRNGLSILLLGLEREKNLIVKFYSILRELEEVLW